MKGLLLVVLALTVAHRPAHAFSACGNNSGLAPLPGSVLPKSPRLLAYEDREFLSKLDYSAQINGKAVGIRATRTFVAPYYMTQLEVQSDKTGTLVVFRGPKPQEVARYEIRADAKLPKEIAGSTRRFTHNIRHSTVKELYDALAIELPDGTPAIRATVKIRRDAQVPWQTFDLPVNPGDFMDKHTTIRIGALGCASNYTVGLLEQGVDLQVTVTLADGSTRSVKLPARVVLPKATKSPDPDDP